MAQRVCVTLGRVVPIVELRIRGKLACVVLGGVCVAGLAAGIPRDRAARPGPRLVVLLVVDQMRADYIEKYGQQWTGGLRRLLDGGAWFTEARYPYLNTVTCPGHATVSTGTFPSKHGMVLNSWWDRKARKAVSCIADPLSPVVSYGKPLRGGASARHLLAPTLGERLRRAPGRRKGRVVSLSVKVRSAIMLAGRKADLVTWFDVNRGTWLTSAAYAQAPVAFLKSFLASKPVEADYGKSWERQLPESSYLHSDDAPEERPPLAGWDASFPHVLQGNGGRPDAAFYGAWRMSPYADSYLGEMAMAIADVWRLGRGKGTDVIAIGFSALDMVGHEFGPRSHEVQDVLARLDATIGTLLAHLDRTVGAENYVVALTADHGVAMVPEQLRAEGSDAGRVHTQAVRERAEAELQAQFGPGQHVAAVMHTDLYFAPGIFEKLRADRAAMERVRQAILSIPGVGQVLRGDELSSKGPRADAAERAAALSYFPGRSGDLIVVPKANWFFVTAAGEDPGAATTHGTAHWYDARVPLLLYGSGVRPGKYSQEATPADIAPTLAQLCGIQLPGASGRVLTESLTDAKLPPR